TYDQKPEMSAHEVSKNVLDAINSNDYDLIVVNFANGDMVGHTGKLDKTIEAVEALDKCVGEIIDRLLAVGGEAIISADHGNCEYMIDNKTSEIITSHSVFDVPIIVISDRVSKIENGKLCDISPTLLAMMGVDIPKEMTGHSIIELNKEVN
ncbi:MAG: 2,3-bisphosphoglycerate-independent phosphoglycerate mutase, partial [Ignavibacteria bacterium]|nr:2,3-bisphosphoglycerate-independent phosphoglycerate mutase [Ignavibacteria bacterium]